MMKKTAAALAALLCAGVGLLRWLDLAGNTDPATGFLLSGEVWMRYVLLAMPVLAIALAAFALPGNTSHHPTAWSMVPAFCGMLFSGIIGIFLFWLGHSSPLQLAAAILLALGSLWFSGYVVHPGRSAPWLGLLGAAGWAVAAVALFCTRIASIHHLLPIAELLCTLGCLAFLAGLLHNVYTEEHKGGSRALFFRGMLGFYCGACLLLPQEAWQWQNGVAAGFLEGKCVAAALLGASGLLVAIRCAGDEGTTVIDADDPAAVAAAFEEAGRRLQEELAHTDPVEELPAVPAAEAAPQRWRSAASALYGGAPVPAPDAAPSQPKPAPVQAPAPAAAQPTARPASAPAAAAKPTAPAAGPVAEQPAAVTRAAEPVPTVPAAPAVPSQPAAKPGGNMDRLAGLVSHLEQQPAKPDSVDDILADLGIARPAEPAAQLETADGEKWVFRRR